MDASLIAIPACSVLMLIKGGQHGFLRNRVENKIFHRVLDGKILSTAGFGLVCLFFVPYWQAALGAIGWLTGVAPSIGEDIAAQREGNWRGTLQRGVFLGAMIALTLWNPAFILAGATFPVWYGLCVKYNKGDWGPAEWAQGAVIGAVLAFS